MSYFNSAYLGTPPWDIGRPQGEFVKLEETDRILGDVLDVGCGTGENALYLAGRGHKVLGVDSAELAIKKAKQKAKERGIRADFKVRDVLRLSDLGRQFDTVIDCGFFHTLSNGGRVVFEQNLASVLRNEGVYSMLAFSDEEPDWGGPRRVSKREIRDTFSAGWQVESIKRARFEDHFHGDGGRAWMSAIRKV